ncbi:MAG: hypothetical protein HC915_12240 [Anaerolineae bacterium]|nr:hypothetical protein [Anaerolineae bacterium]
MLARSLTLLLVFLSLLAAVPPLAAQQDAAPAITAEVIEASALLYPSPRSADLPCKPCLPGRR